ncbi:hypothetical protein CDIOL_37150 [Clostridium diolis]|uniref:Uncharacterized protein n=1 Tax=Clostridium diolis TaxID=223919 RepID=A0AAV3W354_9CLOT|nr:hypothetical protein CDIOL_37150 [Clostridium diolis]
MLSNQTFYDVVKDYLTWAIIVPVKKDCIKQETGNMTLKAHLYYYKGSSQEGAVKKSMTIYNEGKLNKN